MNAIIPVTPQPGGLVPASMSEAMKLAEMMASAKLVPVGLQKSPADCLMVIQQAIRWQMDPFAVAQECSVISGKLMHSGKLVAAVVNARGNLTQRLSFEYGGAGPERTITVSGQLQGEPQPRVVDVILKNAATSNKVWETQPDQQLMYHGVRMWARRHTPELMLGVYSPEEFDEPAATPRRPKPPAANVMTDYDPETGEIADPPAVTAPGAAEPAPPSTDTSGGGAGEVTAWQEYTERWDAMLEEAGKGDGRELLTTWNSDAHKKLRREIECPEGALEQLMERVSTKAKELK